MRVFSALVSWSNENKSCIGVDTVRDDTREFALEYKFIITI